MDKYEMRKYLSDKYNNFSHILLEFLESGYTGESDEETIRNFCVMWDGETLAKTISEGRELLELEPFPWEWVGDTCNRLAYDADKNEWNENPESYEAWVLWIIEEVEKEGKRLGKLG